MEAAVVAKSRVHTGDISIEKYTTEGGNENISPVNAGTYDVYVNVTADSTTVCSKFVVYAESLPCDRCIGMIYFNHEKEK